jgi:hypothetical protein
MIRRRISGLFARLKVACVASRFPGSEDPTDREHGKVRVRGFYKWGYGPHTSPPSASACLQKLLFFSFLSKIPIVLNWHGFPMSPVERSDFVYPYLDFYDRVWLLHVMLQQLRFVFGNHLPHLRVRLRHRFSPCIGEGCTRWFPQHILHI